MVTPDTRRRVMLAGAAIVAAIAAAYHNSLAGPFVFDDAQAITENPTIRRLWPLSDVLFPPRGEGLTVEGRPVLNLTLALNYAVGGTGVRGYHGVNTLIHALAALTLFGLVRRTLRLPRLAERFGQAALPLALVVTLLWALHPLQTESVTYVVQRAESLVALFYLLTLYGFLRGVECHVLPGLRSSSWPASGEAGRFRVPSTDPPCSPEQGHRLGVLSPPRRAARWFVFSWLACVIGMATKEVMVSAPLLVLLFDRAFVSGTLREAWRARRRVHTSLFATWLLLGALVLSTGTRGGTAGFGINVTPWQYALTQFEAVTRYLWLSFWPHPLVFDYGTAWVQQAGDVLPYAVVLGPLLLATIAAWWRWPSAAFLALLFFAVLSPTSSFVPGNRQTMAEHRMYLPLASVVIMGVCCAYRTICDRRAATLCLAGGLAAAAALGGLTVRRNADYRSELVLYRDTVLKRPGNGFARYNLGKACTDAGLHAEALPEYEAALRLMPGSPGIHYNLANSLVELGRHAEARAQFEHALRIDPQYVNARFNLGNLLVRLGERAAAVPHFQAILQSRPEHLEARVNLAGALLELGRLNDAQGEFERALRQQPDSVEAHFGLGSLFLLQQRWPDAAREFEAVLRLRPELAVARERLELARGRR